MHHDPTLPLHLQWPILTGALGWPIVLWEVDTEDWKNRDAAVTTAQVMEGAYPGAIVLMHDIHPSTAKALPGIISGLQERGYTLVTLPELVGQPRAHTVVSGQHSIQKVR